MRIEADLARCNFKQKPNQ